MIEDLSLYHQPVRNLFPRPGTADDWEKLELTTEQCEFFHENGYVSGIRLLDPNQVDVLREELTHLMDPGYPGNSLFYEFHANESSDRERVLFHALGAWRITPGFHDLLWNPAFLVPASQLLGGPVRFWHDQLFCKPARHGGVVAWHQDYSYWTRTVPLSHLTCWIALDDATEENGCVHYIPGSHRWDLLPVTGLAGDMQSIQRVLTPEQRDHFRPVPAEVRAGECIFHHGLTIHGSFENHSERPRRGVVLNVALDGVRASESGVLLEGVPPCRKGEQLGGRFFPLLYEGRPQSRSSDRQRPVDERN